ncbi:MAG: hypothetical protein HOC23_08695 [Halieaceae bacterium]|jgi:hypothetical protein|nr:hypothetical protein [Halieaceae bacterium]
MPILNKNLTSQLSSLSWNRAQPLIVVDADEVLLQFVCGLERFLASRNLWFDVVSYKLFGNIKEVGTNTPVSEDSVKLLLHDFFIEASHNLDPVPGASAALESFAARAQIVVLSNVPETQKTQRRDNLHQHGMPYPVVANEGLKDEAMAMMAAQTDAPVFLLDDITHHLKATKERLPHCHCIHIIGDPRLSALVPEQTTGTYRAADWDAASGYIDQVLIDYGL